MNQLMRTLKNIDESLLLIFMIAFGLYLGAYLVNTTVSLLTKVLI